MATTRYGIPQLQIKRGQSLVLGCTARGETGQPVDLSGCTVTAQARHAGRLVADLTVTLLHAAQGEYELSAPGDTTTETWPVGAVEVDIVYELPPAAGRRTLLPTETFVVNVVQRVTEVQ